MTTTTIDLDAYAEHLRGPRGLGAGTVTAYTGDIRRFLAFRAQLDQQGALADDLMIWVLDARLNLSASSCRRRLESAKSYLRFLGQATTKLDEYRRPPASVSHPHPLPGGIDAARRLLEATTGALQAAIALQSLAGLRITEAITLTRAADLGSHLRVKGKGEKERMIPVSAELRRYLDAMPATGTLAPIGNSTVRRRITRVASDIGVAGANGGTVSSHDLRATFATAVYAKKGDIVLVSRLLGHASVQTTMVYLGLADAAAAEAVEF